MAARKLQQEMDKTFKKVAEGSAEFDAIYEKIEQSNNPAQKEKLEDQLKREIKKLQRLRDQIKTWAAGNEVKDKAPLLEHRRLIETQMERFKAVEKAMKTKAYSKEGLSAAAKLDPKEQAKAEASEFLSNTVDTLEQQIESMETECESIQATMKKGKSASAKAERIAKIEAVIETHKWHQGKIELIRRALENDSLDVEQIKDVRDGIQYYVTDGMNDDYIDDDTLYDELDLQEEEDTFGMNPENDKGSSQDTQSVQEEKEPTEPESRPGSLPGKTRSAMDPAGRRPSGQLKSPLPTLATLHTPLSTVTNNTSASASSSMKPALLPQRAPGEGLKYASAAAAAANNVGIGPLPPPPGVSPVISSVGISPLPPAAPLRASAANSPSTVSIQPARSDSRTGSAPVSEPRSADPTTSIPSSTRKSAKADKAASRASAATASAAETSESSRVPYSNGASNGTIMLEEQKEEEESIFHLPAALQDLVDSYEAAKKRPLAVNSGPYLRMLAASQNNITNHMDPGDAEPTRTHRPEMRYHSEAGYPQESLPILEDPRLYSRIEPDTLFYVFYYKQGSYQQYVAAKALKDQSWRFHKQYQTWFQRHEEPKNITEEFEQGTYRFFDYESTWMNRRKADFKFAYRYLEDEV
ncbi:Not1 N-terminal domain, CCR4-Not complex component-domain-containing protein [Xylariaceae sp. FL1272]|nr:Not1 N-terminal domain, CCR4-Not complex component-domain-containing protein [Xylariaceae sp. FL1272]